MNTFKAKVNKIILGLTSVGLIILLMLPGSLSANHFRSGTLSWAHTDNNTIIRLYGGVGWTADHSAFNAPNDYSYFPGSYEGAIKHQYQTIFWGDGTHSNTSFKIISRDNSSKDTISEMGEYENSTWVKGVSHQYPDNGTTNYIVYWTNNDREGVQNNNGVNWRIATKVNIGGATTNSSPVSAVPPIVKIQDNTTFQYQLGATDTDGDSLGFRWGTKAEFFAAGDNATSSFSAGDYAMPTGMTLSPSGLIEWDVRNTGGQATVADHRWGAVIMIEDNDSSSGDNKSYIPLDFVFKISSATNIPPAFTAFYSGTQTVVIGDNKTFTIKSTDADGGAPTISILNPPSDNRSIWSDISSTSGLETTHLIFFAPDSAMDNETFVVNVRSTDDGTMTKDQNLSLKVTSVSNADPTAPTLVSPADNSTVTEPVLFQWEKSTDADNDNVSYTLYICPDIGFTGSGLCTGTSVTAGVNFVPPFNQNPHDSLISWPSTLHAEMISQQISQDFSMIPKLVIMLGVLGLLGVIISLSVKNISHRRIIYMLFLIIIGTVSCMANYNEIDDDSNTSDTTETTALTLSEVTAVTTPTTDKTPDYTFSSTKAGTITYGGSCTSSITECFKGNNTITFSTLSYGTYDNCTITVTDTDNSSSSPLAITAFTVFTNDVTYTYSNLTPDTYYWKVVASDPKGGTANSATWSFHIQ